MRHARRAPCAPSSTGFANISETSQIGVTTLQILRYAAVAAGLRVKFSPADIASYLQKRTVWLLVFSLEVELLRHNAGLPDHKWPQGSPQRALRRGGTTLLRSRWPPVAALLNELLHGVCCRFSPPMLPHWKSRAVGSILIRLPSCRGRLAI